MIEALLLGVHSEWRQAIERTRPLLSRDHEPGHGDPFVRSILHSSRAQWYERLAAVNGGLRSELRDSVLGEWRWVQNVDLSGWVTGPPQSAEVDWVLGPWADARVVRFTGDASACDRAHRILRWWSAADETLVPTITALREFAAAHCEQ